MLNVRRREFLSLVGGGQIYADYRRTVDRGNWTPLIVHSTMNHIPAAFQY